MSSQSTVAIVGGASGIGLASAHKLAEAGYRIALADADTQALESAAQELRNEGAKVEIAPLNVLDVAAIDRCISSFAKDNRLHGLVNTAGIYQKGQAVDVSEPDWDRLIDINLKGTFFACRAAIEVMRAGGGGSIVNLASQSGRTKSYYSAPSYSTSKAGVIGLTMTLAAQHGADNIRVNAVAPGVVDTPMTANSYSEEERAAMKKTIPLGRFASASEMADIITFLISDRSSYVTGQTINANGGAWMI